MSGVQLGVGEAVNSGLNAGIEAARLAGYAFDSAEASLSAFESCLNLCGILHLPALQNVFDFLNGVSLSRATERFQVSPGVPKAGGQLQDRGYPNDLKKTDPAPLYRAAAADSDGDIDDYGVAKGEEGGEGVGGGGGGILGDLGSVVSLREDERWMPKRRRWGGGDGIAFFYGFTGTYCIKNKY
ncbi:hypothetical protein K432DRAFT_401231 [Lepidopterella palustris CBS 459.81]|uniref:Uncharacterized protein n=1 Tax=Lepidopterella palustris CBS 459.81 TaxID=1314670 RepID=A0A8E2JIW7_9PEZI|nr:hypothetical protein K432DRAFT_401231 [Lepidopterella palustris CBS 459.81]